MHTTLNNTTSE